jgi:hypothetical protein
MMQQPPSDPGIPTAAGFAGVADRPVRVPLSRGQRTVSRRGSARYREYLSDEKTFDSVTLEAIVDVIRRETPAPWIREVRERYLGWEKFDRTPLP